MENLSCKVCLNKQADQFKIVYALPTFQVYCCTNCGFHFVPASFTEDVQYDHFKSESELHTVRKGNDWLKIERHKHRIRTIKRYKPHGHLFDLGVGWGHFLAAARDMGFDVSGVEVSRHQFTYAHDDLELPVECIDFFDYTGKNESLDIITMWDVLEHIEDVKPALHRIHSLLNDDGILVIQVPQIDSYIARKTKEKWSMLSHTHVNYFSPKTITRVLQDNGFEVISIRSSVELKLLLMYVVYPWLRKLKGTKKETITSNERQSYFNKVTERPKWMLRFAIIGHNIIYDLLSFLKIGEEMIVVAKKSKNKKMPAE